ncbi:hypothetical protein B0H16DRAFT_1695628 [Mycena metata]|uniref:Uncharacterized protein n=1 Tax=Mycena metata TaxID=1033252 RepID=A0AAD7I5I9_9AGAR|nr:hypothetical protein B0H16DRAFT_1695628 [Mycena metata]
MPAARIRMSGSARVFRGTIHRLMQQIVLSLLKQTVHPDKSWSSHPTEIQSVTSMVFPGGEELEIKLKGILSTVILQFLVRPSLARGPSRKLEGRDGIRERSPRPRCISECKQQQKR